MLRQSTPSSSGARSQGRSRALRLAPLALVAALGVMTTFSYGAASASNGTGDGHRVAKAPTDRLDGKTLEQLKAAKLGKPIHAATTSAVKASAGSPVDPIELRVLVMATKGDPNPDGVNTVPAGTWDWNLSTLTSALDYIGVPYDVYKSTTKQLCVNGSWKINYQVNGADSSCTTGQITNWNNGVTADRMWDGGVHAYYQGVMLTNGTLSYVDPANTFVSSALTADEWAALWTFEAAFNIRTVSANTYPTADFGLTYVGEGGANTSARWTAAGATAFPSVNASGTLPITSSYVYRAAVTAGDTTTTPILTDPSGNVLGAIHTYPTQGNRQALALTFDSAGYLTHGQVLGYGLVNWVTKGLFLGERHAILDPQPDDIFISDSIWQTTTVCGTAPDDPSLPEARITGTDLQRFITWQTAKQAVAISKPLKIEFPFNGEGTTAAFNAPNVDTLTPVAKANQARFKWVNHTYTHQNLDAVTYAQARTEIRQNNQVATQLGLSTFNRKNLIQPDISGLSNAQFLQAAYDTGIRYLISDTSRTGDPATYGVNEGRYNALQPAILEIARYPVNLYFNVSTPEQWLAEDNCLYPANAAFGHVDTYQQLLDRESNVLLRYLLQGHNRPLMFHQPNLTAYDGTHSLLGDLVDATLAKYSQLVKVPLISPTMDQLGVRQADRMKYNDALRNGGLSASIVPGTSITLTAQKAVTVPVTGLNAPAYKTEFYGSQRISYITLAAGQSVTLPLQ